MTRVDLTYNPYTRERKLVIDSKEIPGNQTSNFCGAKGTELSQWCETLWERLASHCYLRSNVRYYVNDRFSTTDFMN